HASHRALRLATGKFLFCRRALPLRDRRRNFVLSFCRLLLLVPQNDGKDAERKLGQTAFLAVPHRVSPHLRRDARSRCAWHAAPHLHLRARPRLGNMEFHFNDWRIHPGRRDALVRWESYLFVSEGPESRERSLGCLDTRMVGEFAAACL